jgi:two-component system, NtrC family, response regulator HydG
MRKTYLTPTLWRPRRPSDEVLMSADSKPKIMVVDDELEMATMLAEALGERGYRVLALRSGREALRRMRLEPFDALITDLRMLDVDGLALLTASRALDPSRPVILMTGYGALDTALEASRHGAYHYVTKPFRPSTLVHLIEVALGQPASSHE